VPPVGVARRCSAGRPWTPPRRTGGSAAQRFGPLGRRSWPGDRGSGAVWLPGESQAATRRSAEDFASAEDVLERAPQRRPGGARPTAAADRGAHGQGVGPGGRGGEHPGTGDTRVRRGRDRYGLRTIRGASARTLAGAVLVGPFGPTGRGRCAMVADPGAPCRPPSLPKATARAGFGPRGALELRQGRLEWSGPQRHQPPRPARRVVVGPRSLVARRRRLAVDTRLDERG